MRGTYTYTQHSYRRGGVHIHTHNTPIEEEGYIYIHTTLLQYIRGTSCVNDCIGILHVKHAILAVVLFMH